MKQHYNYRVFRDVSFYIVSLLLLVLFFVDEKIVWYEALVLFTVYIMYAIFMRYNLDIEKLAKVRMLGMDPSVLDSEFESITVTYKNK